MTQISRSRARRAARPDGRRELERFAVVIAARFGPLELGTVVTCAGISLRPSDAGLTVPTGEPLWMILCDVPVALRTRSLTLDGPGLVRDPPSCAEPAVRASFTAVVGARARAAAAPYRATSCGAPGFPRRVSVSVVGRRLVRKRAKPPLRVVITGAHSQADVRALSVALPPALGLAGRRPTLQLAVTQARSGVVTVSLSGRGAGSATVTLRRRLHRLAAAPAELRRRPRLAFSPEATAADGYRSAERSERG